MFHALGEKRIEGGGGAGALMGDGAHVRCGEANGEAQGGRSDEGPHHTSPSLPVI
jgi:hypothetical protein